MPSLINQDGTRNYPEFRRLVWANIHLWPMPLQWWMLRSEWKDREADYQILRAQWRVRNGLADDRKMSPMSESFARDLAEYEAMK